MNCPKCGTQNRDEAEICSVCQGSLNTASAAPDGQTAEPPAPLTADTSQAVVSPKTSGLAIASLALSIAGILDLFLFSCAWFFMWLTSIILGFIALSKIKKQPELFKGQGLAVAGIVISLIAIIYIILDIMHARGGAEFRREIMCHSQLSGIGFAIMMYQNDFDGQNPPDLQALVETVDVDPRALVCPCTDDKAGEISYIYRGADLDTSAPSSMILAYDKLENHPSGSISILFAGTHVNKCLKEGFQAIIARDNELRRERGLPEKPIE